MGTRLFLKFLSDSNNPNLTAGIPVMSSSELIFTRKLTRESGFIEWDIVQKLINNKPITKDETSNPLIKLRLTHHPERTNNILPDLIRGLDGYEKVWTIAETRKGKIIISLSLDLSRSQTTKNSLVVLLPGKPSPIPYADFTKYYLNV